MNVYILLAEAFRYPQPGLLEQLEEGLTAVGDGPAQAKLAVFVKKVGEMPLADWEDLCTRTLDLSPSAAPYIGFQIWGETYQRGVFMAQLNRAMAAQDIDPEGELPDHLVPVLRYLASTNQPVPDLVEHFETAVERMVSVLRGKDKGNPYVALFEAALAAFHAGRVASPPATSG